MKFAFSSNAFRRFSLAETIAAVADLGYEGIEIMADAPHAWPPDLAPGEVAKIRRTLADRHLQIANLNAFTMAAAGDTWNPSWIDPDPRQRRRRIDHTRRCLELAAALGVPHLSTEPGGALDGRPREEALALFRDGLAAVEGAARATGVRILIEPEPALTLETSAHYLEFCASLDPRVFGLNFDIGHFFCAGDDVPGIVRSLREHIAHVHLEDIPPSREHRHLIPGTGAVPLPEVLAALAAIGYAGFVTVELYPYQDRPAEAARLSRDYLRSAGWWSTGRKEPDAGSVPAAADAPGGP